VEANRAACSDPRRLRRALLDDEAASSKPSENRSEPDSLLEGTLIELNVKFLVLVFLPEPGVRGPGWVFSYERITAPSRRDRRARIQWKSGSDPIFLGR